MLSTTVIDISMIPPVDCVLTHYGRRKLSTNTETPRTEVRGVQLFCDPDGTRTRGLRRDRAARYPTALRGLATTERGKANPFTAAVPNRDPDTSRKAYPQRDSNPCYRRERAGS